MITIFINIIKYVVINMMANRWRTKNEVIFHESEILRENQYEIANFRSGQTYEIQVFLKKRANHFKLFQKTFLKSLIGTYK